MNQGFSRSLRLLNQHQFKPVFDSADLRLSAQGVLLLARFNELEHSRLGLVIGKKNVKLAVQRNRIKRQIREYFRQKQAQLPGMDIVVIARKNLDTQENQELQSTLATVWKRLIRQSEAKIKKFALQQTVN